MTDAKCFVFKATSNQLFSLDRWYWFFSTTWFIIFICYLKQREKFCCLETSPVRDWEREKELFCKMKLLLLSCFLGLSVCLSHAGPSYQGMCKHSFSQKRWLFRQKRPQKDNRSKINNYSLRNLKYFREVLLICYVLRTQIFHY